MKKLKKMKKKIRDKERKLLALKNKTNEYKKKDQTIMKKY